MKLIRGIAWGLLASFICSGAALAEPGWSVTQSSTKASLSGQMTIYVTAMGMRTYDPKNGVSLMTRGPNWTVYIYNTKTRRIFQSPLQPWLASFKQRGISGRFEGAGWRAGNKNGMVAGQRAYEFVMDKAPPIRTNSKTLSGKVRQYSNAFQAASLWVAYDIATPKEVSQILSQLYGIPVSERLPLRMTAIENGKQTVFMDTVKVMRMDVPASSFAVPGGLQPVKQDSDVFIDQDSMDTLDEMLQDLDAPSTPRRRPATPQQRPGTVQRR